jgi:integrase
MNLVITLDLVKSLKIEKKPVGIDAKNRIVYEDNPARTPYIVYDASDSAPPGFGLKVAGKKTYIIRRKIGGKGVMPTVGNVADFPDLASAREKAARMALKIVDSGGANPNAEAAKVAASEISLGQVLQKRLDHLKTKDEPIRVTTVKIYKRAIRYFDGLKWSGRRIRDITPDEIYTQFQIRKKTFPTVNEQNFRFAIAAIEDAIREEALAANAQRRDATLIANPFFILHLKSQFRSRKAMEILKEEKHKRNPLTSANLGRFLEVAWPKRLTNDNETGVHSLVLSILFGTRAQELLQCKWIEFVPENERVKQSHICLEDDTYGPFVFLSHDMTKARRARRLPIPPMALVILKRRQVAAAEESLRRGFNRSSRQWVFPAKSKYSKSGHYTNSQTLLDVLAEEAGIERLTRHDARRTLGQFLTACNVHPATSSIILGHAVKAQGEPEGAVVSAIYTKPEFSLIRTEMERVEQAILATAPNVYNSLKPVEWPPLAAPPPHIPRPAKQRTGRPKKEAAASESEISGG